MWSEWGQIDAQQSGGLAEMEASIREDLCGIEMLRHREDLIQRLDHVLGRLNTWDHPQHTQYNKLRTVLLEVDAEAMNALARKPPRLIFFGLLTPTDMYRIPLDVHVHPASTVSIVHSLRSTALSVYWLSYYLHISSHSPCRPTLWSGF